MERDTRKLPVFFVWIRVHAFVNNSFNWTLRT